MITEQRKGKGEREENGKIREKKGTKKGKNREKIGKKWKGKKGNRERKREK